MDQQSAAVLSGIDLLMNQRKRAGGSGSSDAMSVVSSSSSRSRHSVGAASVSSSGRGPPRPTPLEATVANPGGLPPIFQRIVTTPAQQRPYVESTPPHPLPPQQQQQRRAFVVRDESDAGSDSGSGSGSEYAEDDDEDGEDDDGEDGEEEDEEEDPRARSRSSMSPEQITNAKRDILYQFDRIERKGVRVPRRFTMEDSLDEMRAELERVKLDREVDVSVRFQRKMLMACVTGIELLNSRFDPFDVKLEGWSDSMHEGMGDYDEVFEDLHIKYRGKAKMAPELKLMFMVGGSGVMFHLTSSMFRSSSMPGMEHVMRQNPDLARQFAQATVNTMHQQQPPQQQKPRGGGGGLFGGLLGSLFGGGGGMMGAGGAVPPPPPPPPQQSGPSMRGPQQIDDVLRDLHRGAFPGGSTHHQQQQQQQQDYNSRIEIISNASESELGELPDDTASALGEPTPPLPVVPKRRASGARKPR